MRKIKMTVTKNEKVGDVSKQIFKADLNFQTDFSSFNKDWIDGRTEYGFRVYIQTGMKKFNKAEEVHAWLNKHNGIITPEAIQELDEMKGPARDPQQAYLNKVARMSEGDKQAEIAKMIKQLEAMQK